MNPDSRQLWDHALKSALQAGHILRQKLGLDEANFRFIAPYSHKDSRNVYIYRAIDEVQKTATSLIRWTQFLSTDATYSQGDDTRKHMMRMTVQAVVDEQSLRCRKLVESLVDTILFVKTNEDAYFRDYFCLNEIAEQEDGQRDREEFYGFTSRNSDHYIRWLRDRVRELESSSIDVSRRWYLKEPTSIASIKRVSLSSFRSRYKKIASEQGSEIITLLAKSYLHAYGESRNVHFSASDTSDWFRDDSPIEKGTKAALLMVNLMIRLQDLSLIPSDGSDDPLREVRASLEGTAPYVALTTPGAKVGDYVVVGGDLAKVTEERRSKYGYFSYHVIYISKAPIPEIIDDWFASSQMIVLGSKDTLLATVKSILSKYSSQEIPDSAISSIDDTHFEECLKQSIHDLVAHLRFGIRPGVDQGSNPESLGSLK
jgi:hypothetical protein